MISMNLRQTLILFVLGPVFLAFGLILWFGLETFEQHGSAQIENELVAEARVYGSQIDSTLEQVAQVARSTAEMLSMFPALEEAQLYRLLHENLESNPAIFGAAIAFEPDSYEGKRLFAPYVYRDSEGEAQMDIAEQAYDYTESQWDWWHMPHENISGYWTEPYFDEGAGNTLMTTFAIPFFRDGRIWGVATVDISLDELRKGIPEAGPHGEQYLVLSSQYRYLHSVNAHWLGQTLAKVGKDQGRPEWQRDFIDFVASGHKVTKIRGRKDQGLQWLSQVSIEAADWHFVVMIPQAKALGFIQTQKTRALLILLLVFILAISLALSLLHWTTRPLHQLTEAVRRFAAGKRRFDLPETGADEIVELSANFRDMTEKLLRRESSLKQLNEELEQRVEDRTRKLEHSEARTKALLDATPDSMVVVNPQGEIVFVNQALCRQFGCEYDAVLGKPVEILLPLKVRKAHPQMLAAFFRHPEVRSMGSGRFLKARRFDGSEFPVEVSLSPYQGPDGETLVTAALHDITDRQQSQNKLRESDRRFRAMLQSSFQLIGLVDTQGRIIEANKTAIELAGHGQDLNGRLFWEMPGWGGDAQRMTRMKEAIDAALKGEPQHFETQTVIPDGGLIDIEFSLTPVFNDAGEVTLLIPEGHDITESKRAADEMSRAAEIAEDANRSKSDFLANMSHEIRTPMNAIIGLSHLALGTELTARQQDYLAKIHNSAQSLLGIINDILDFSKIEAGKLDMEAIEFDLSETMDNLANLVSVKTAEKDLEFLISMDSQVPLGLIGDPLRLGQILINLSNNAVKFTETGSITLRVAVAESRQDGVTLRFEVQDTGIGISESQIGKLFKSFSQVDGSTTRKFGGTGLGLAISRKLVEMMGGEIGVDSVEGQGSTFWFLARFGLAENLPQRHELAATPDLQGKRVLIVDDNPTSREILSRMVEQFGFTVSECASGLEAIGEVKAAAQRVTEAGDPEDEFFSLILMDWNMPQMNGLEAAKQIRGLVLPQGVQAPRIVMVSAYGREELLRQSQMQGLEGYLVKPVSESTLFDGIMQAFGQQTTQEAGQFGQHELAEKVRGAHLLLVEDNEINQQVAEELLIDAGIRVTIAEDGQAALNTLTGPDAPSFDGVLMDMQMPVMDGITATREIRKLDRFAKLPIIAMTANAMAGDRERCLDAGMNDHVAKPIDIGELYRALEAWVTAAHPQLPEPVQRAPEAESSADFELPGVNTREGLQRVGGNSALYGKILGKFLDSQSDTPEQIRSSFATGARDEAQRLAHTLKGVAANIGAQALSDAAKQVEAAVRDDAVDIEPLMPELYAQLTLVLGGIAQWQEEKAAQQATLQAGQGQGQDQGQVDTAAVRHALLELKTLLEEDDADALEPLDVLRKQLAGQLSDRLDRLASLIGSYEFEDALPLLENLETEVEAVIQATADGSRPHVDIRALLMELRGYLEDDDAQAEEPVAELRRIVHTEPAKNYVETLARQVGDYDFDAARKTLGKLEFELSPGDRDHDRQFDLNPDHYDVRNQTSDRYKDLIQHLEDHDSDAAVLVRDLMESALTEDEKKVLGQISERVFRFEFEEAITLAKTFMDKGQDSDRDIEDMR